MEKGRKISKRFAGEYSSNYLLRKEIGTLKQKERILEMKIKDMNHKYVCDDCEQLFESESDPRHENYICETVCICEPCNEKRREYVYG